MVDGVKFYLFCVSKKLLYMFVEGDAFISGCDRWALLFLAIL